MTDDERADYYDLVNAHNRARRIARDQVSMLADARHALAAGRLTVTDEFIDRVMTALTRLADVPN